MTRPPRYWAIGGDIVDFCAAQSRVSLREAYNRAGVLSRQALEAEQDGARRLAGIYARECKDLCGAIRDVSDQRRAAGWRDPVHADQPNTAA